MTDAVAAIAGPAGGTPAAPAAPGASGTPGAAAPAAGASFTWDPGLPPSHVDLLKAKGMYDDPIKGANALVNSYFEANKALSGGDVIVKPADFSKAEDVEKFLAKSRGVAKAEEYVPKFEDGVTVHPPLVAFAQKLAFDWGVPAPLFQKGIDAWQAFAKEQNANAETAAAKANDDAITALKTKMGPDAFNGAVANAQTVFKSLVAKGAISRETLAAAEAHIGSAAVVELLAAIGAGMKTEAGVLGNGDSSTPTDPTQMTPEQASAEIKRLEGDADFQKAYRDGTPAGKAAHDVAVERMRRLYEAKTRRPG